MNIKELFLILLLIPFLASCGGGSGSDEEVFNERLSTVTQWNELMLAGIRDGGARPTVTTRQMFIISTAMYDAWTAYDQNATPLYLDASLRRPAAEHTLQNMQAAVGQAAYHSLVAMFNDYEGKTGNFRRYLEDQGLQITSDATGQSAGSIGFLAASSVLQARANDGANEAGDYSQIITGQYSNLYTPTNSAAPSDPNGINGPNFNPNRWTPLRVPNGINRDEFGVAILDDDDDRSFFAQEYLTPHWGAVTPFALNSASEHRPPAPPQFGSNAPYTDALGRTTTNNEAWNMQIDQVLQFSADLTDRQKVSAEFWADGPRTEAPPGHWNQLAHGVSIRDNHSIEQDVKMYFALNGALLDAGIATWEAKRHYDYIRPVTAIRWKYSGQPVMAWAGPNNGTKEINGSDWRPYQNVTFVTPPFPEFVSGHSTFSRSAAEVLTAFTGSDQFYDGVTNTAQDVNDDGVDDFLGEYIQRKNNNIFENTPDEDVVLRWNTFFDAAAEAGLSRLYGGIHIQDGDLRGRELGSIVGKKAFTKAAGLWD